MGASDGSWFASRVTISNTSIFSLQTIGLCSSRLLSTFPCYPSIYVKYKPTYTPCYRQKKRSSTCTNHPGRKKKNTPPPPSLPLSLHSSRPSTSYPISQRSSGTDPRWSSPHTAPHVHRAFLDASPSTPTHRSPRSSAPSLPPHQEIGI